MSVTTLLAFLTFVGVVPMLAYVTWYLWRLWRKYHNPVTSAHAITMTVLLVILLVHGPVYLNNDLPSLGLGPPIIDTDTTKLITRAVMFGGGLTVALVRLRLMFSGRKP